MVCLLASFARPTASSTGNWRTGSPWRFAASMASAGASAAVRLVPWF